MEEEIAEEKNENDSNDGRDSLVLVPDTNVQTVSAKIAKDETKKAKTSKG